MSEVRGSRAIFRGMTTRYSFRSRKPVPQLPFPISPFHAAVLTFALFPIDVVCTLFALWVCLRHTSGLAPDQIILQPLTFQPAWSYVPSQTSCISEELAGNPFKVISRLADDVVHIQYEENNAP